MKKRTYDIAFKNEVIDYCDAGHTPYAAALHFGERDQCKYEVSNFYQGIGWGIKRPWKKRNAGEEEVDVEELEAIPQDDELYDDLEVTQISDPDEDSDV